MAGQNVCGAQLPTRYTPICINAFQIISLSAVTRPDDQVTGCKWCANLAVDSSDRSIHNQFPRLMAKHGKFHTTIEYALVRSLIGGLGLMPRKLAVAIGLFVGRIGYAVGGGLRRIGERNLELALPDLKDDERQRILRGAFSNLGRMLGEVSQFRKATKESLRDIVEYHEEAARAWRDVDASGRGIIFLTGHIGSWELLSFAHSALEQPISFLVRPIDNPRVEAYIESIRTRFGNKPIDKKMAARSAIRTLREGGTLGILADLNTQPREGVFVPFFGRLACTTAGAATLALRTNAVVIPTCAVWDESKRKYFFYGEQPLELIRTGDDKKDIELNTARFTESIERMVRLYPDQWLWIHRRWRTRPEGEPDLY
jgi:KDO2-lipid IV(A) lauroyltransferase